VLGRESASARPIAREGSLLFDRQGKRYIGEVVIALRSSAAAVRR